MMSPSEARSGVLANAEGIAALNEWPEKFFALLPIWCSSSDTTVVVKIFVVRFFPLSKLENQQVVGYACGSFIC
jgi:hypothetical protein